jgi:hypothetical protein
MNDLNNMLMPAGQAEPNLPEQPKELTTPEPEELAKKWKKEIESARKFWEKFHKRVRHNRKTVAGFDWSKDPDSEEFYKLRANLIQGTITAVLPNIYARNPEMSATPEYKSDKLKLLCKTVETVTNKCLTKANLKKRAKAAVRAALTCSFGIVKVMYQRDMQEDPIIIGRINDTQDNIERIEGLLAQMEDPEQTQRLDETKAQLETAMQAYSEKAEIVAAEGLVIDRVLTDNLLIDPSVCEFEEYLEADWMAQIIPMRKSDAEAKFKMKFGSAKTYEHSKMERDRSGQFASAKDGETGDCEICVLEIWDKRDNLVHTLVEGCDYFARPSFAPKLVGERWYPFFLLPYQLVDGQFVAPSLVDLTDKLQREHNLARDRFNQHRDLALPGYISGSDTTEKSLKRFTDSQLGEVTLIDTDGKPLNQVIIPKQHPPIDPMVYDTSAIRSDWEQTTGLQDAARSTVVKPKTATEARIMDQSLAGRVSGFRDELEDYLQEIAQYTSQILLLAMTPEQVERIMGPHKMKPLEVPAVDAAGMPVIGPNGQPVMQPQIGADGQPIMMVDVPSYDWPTMSRDEVFDLISMNIRAGTTGAPNQLETQEMWLQLLPIIQPLITQIMQMRAQGLDAEPLIELLRETCRRFDDRIEVERFIGKLVQPAPVAPGMAAPGAALPEAAQTAV